MSEAPSRYSAPYQVLLMIAIIVATILLGFFMMPSSQEEGDRLLSELGTTNHGTLLKPVKPIFQLPLTDENGAPWIVEDQKRKWRLLILPVATCDRDCEQLLYITRQVHVRLAKYATRVERVFVAIEGLPDERLAAEIAENHPHIRVLHTTASAVDEWLAGTNNRYSDGVAEAVLMDPAGVAMMVYDDRHSGNGMLEDLNHLLKYSPQ